MIPIMIGLKLTGEHDIFYGQSTESFKKNVSTVYNGIDKKSILPANQLPVKTDKKIILTIARIAPLRIFTYSWMLQNLFQNMSLYGLVEIQNILLKSFQNSTIFRLMLIYLVIFQMQVDI